MKRKDVESQSTDRKGTARHKLWWTLLIDVPLLCVVIIASALAEEGVIPSHKSGFYCNDPILSYKFTSESISMAAILLTVFVMPLVVIVITELIFIKGTDLQRSKYYQAIINTLWVYRMYVYGFLFNMGAVEVMKGFSGNPRPTFFDLCEPDTAKNCTGSQFVPTFQCTSTRFSKKIQSDSFRSFPSGHTSLSVHCALFLGWYLQKRAFSWKHRSVFVVPFVQLLLLGYAALFSLSRITEHRHHWWDVLVGSVIGVLSGLYAVLALCKNFTTYVKSNEEKEISTYDEKRHIITT